MTKILQILLLVLTSQAAWALEEVGELLPNEQAFIASAKAVDGSTIKIHFDIAPATYMYRDKFKFDSATTGITLGTPAIPKGKIKEDIIFGKVETYRTGVDITLPVERSADAGDVLQVSVTSQGCADLGVCYPPLIQNVKVKLPAAQATAAGAVSQLSAFGDSLGLGQGEQEFLPPDEAFAFTAGVNDSNSLEASWNIADGYYLYRNKLVFSISGDDGITLGEPVIPAGKVKEDPGIGKTETYRSNLNIPLPLQRSHGDAATLQLTVTFQGCADAGLCYPPMTRTVALEVPASGTAASTGTDGAAATTASAGSFDLMKYLKAMAGAFGVGLLLTFTPCVLPMIPILSSQIVGEGGEHVSKMRGGLMSASYVLGTAVVYTAAGILAGYSGDQLQAYFQNAWAIGILAGVLGLMALSMFGLFTLQMPGFIQSRMQQQSFTIQGGSFIRTFIMGILSSLIVGACVSPLLITVLSLAIATADPVLGGVSMFAMAMGMGVILVMVGIGAGAILPRAGTWMDAVKHVFGVLLLAVAIYLLGVLPQVPVLFLWAALFIITGIYMGATQPIPEGSSGWSYFNKGLGTLLLIWGVLALIGGMYGNRDIVKPLPDYGARADMPAGIAPAGAATAVGKVEFTKVTSLAELEQTLSQARQANKPVMIDFYATWCTDCLRMEKDTFVNADVSQRLNTDFVAIKVDVTDPNNADSKELKKHFGVFGPPAVLFFDASGKARKELNFYGYRKSADFLAILNKV
jgi:thiol:disulfide interchange protein DsbD